MDQANRGIVLLLNFEVTDKEEKKQRTGSLSDMMLLEVAFASLEFTVVKHTDLTKLELENLIKFYSERDFGKEDCFACVIMSHGNGHAVRTRDNQEFELVNLFNSIGENETLATKPKIFIMHTFIESKNDYYAPEGRLPINTLHFYFFIFEGSSVLESQTGSVLIHYLCTTLKEYGKTKLLDSMLKRVIRLTLDHASNVSVWSHESLTKDIHFKEKKAAVE